MGPWMAGVAVAMAALPPPRSQAGSGRSGAPGAPQASTRPTPRSPGPPPPNGPRARAPRAPDRRPNGRSWLPWGIPLLAVGVVALGAVIYFAAFYDPPGVKLETGAGINLVSARDLGCSLDGFTGPDLEIVVAVDGKEVLRAHGQDHRAPLFASFAEVERGGTVTVTASDLEITQDTLCDLDPGSATTASFEWDGGHLEKLLRGAGERAAEVVLVLGKPDFRVGPVTADADADSVKLSWDRLDPAPANIQIARGTHGEVAERLAGDLSSAHFSELCDGVEHHLRVIAQDGAWWIGTPVNFTTTNLPPAPPVVLHASRTNSMLSVRWQDVTPHDTEEHEVHGVGAAGVVSAATLRGTFKPAGSTGSAYVTLQPQDTHIRIVQRDHGGLTTASAPFLIGSPDVEAPKAARCGDGPLSGSRDYDTPVLPVPFLLAGLGLAAAARLRRRAAR